MVRFTRGRRCQIAKWKPEWWEKSAPCCGKPATWWSDDITEGTTVWMCDEHQEELARDCDSAGFEREAS